MATDLIRHSIKVQRDSGVSRLAQKTISFIYRLIYPYLGPINRILNPYELLLSIGYEHQYVSAIQKYTRENENIVLIGGGDGVSAVTASKQVQPNGMVQIYEGGKREVKKTNRMLKINNIHHIATVNHTIVSNDFSLRSSSVGAEILPPAELPECDVLAIDADGAEIPILEGLTIRPEKLIIEHHLVPKNEKNPSEIDLEIEFQPDTVRLLIEDTGYEIVEELSDATQAYGRFQECVFVAKRK